MTETAECTAPPSAGRSAASSISRALTLLLALLPVPAALFYAAWHASLDAQLHAFWRANPGITQCTASTLAVANEAALVSCVLFPAVATALFWFRCGMATSGRPVLRRVVAYAAPSIPLLLPAGLALAMLRVLVDHGEIGLAWVVAVLGPVLAVVPIPLLVLVDRTRPWWHRAVAGAVVGGCAVALACLLGEGGFTIPYVWWQLHRGDA